MDMETQVFSIDPERLSGVPVFAGTRVPVEMLIDFFVDGGSLSEFLDDYPGVTQEQAVAFLVEATRLMLERYAPGAPRWNSDDRGV